MAYSPIAPLPPQEELDKLASSELASLRRLWLEKKGRLEHSGEYRRFIEKTQREWAIETGIIERLYHWDRGVTETLIEQGIDAALISHGSGANRDEAENIARMIQDQKEVVDGLFSFVKNEQPLTEHFIRAMHQRFTAHQDFTEAMTPEGEPVKASLLKGEYKRQPNNPKKPDGSVHEYCPPERVIDEMESLVNLYLEYEPRIDPATLSAWLHHRFAQIHPFQDGNGRVARALASLVFLKAGLFPLVIRDSEREEYLSALEEADNGDLSRLARLFVKRQRDSALSAILKTRQKEPAASIKQIIEGAVAVLSKRGTEEKGKAEAIYIVAESLREKIESRLAEIRSDLDLQLGTIKTDAERVYKVDIRSVRAMSGVKPALHRQFGVNQYGVFRNDGAYQASCELIIATDNVFGFNFDIYGHQESKIMFVSGFTFEETPSKEGVWRDRSDSKISQSDIFQFNYLESEADIVKRFDEWLEGAITVSLAEWRKTLG